MASVAETLAGARLFTTIGEWVADACGGGDDRRGLARAVADSETVILGPNRVAFLLGGADIGGRFSLTEFVMTPAAAPGQPLHVHACEEETIYLIEGRLSVTLLQQATELSSGAIAHVPKGVRTR